MFKHILEDMKLLRLEMPEKLVRATEHIPDMAGRRLKSCGIRDSPHDSDGSVYFRIASFSRLWQAFQDRLLRHPSRRVRVDQDEYEEG